MATPGQWQRDLLGAGSTELAGIGWTVCGALLFVAYPVARIRQDHAIGFWGAVEGTGQPLACLGAILLVLGACTLGTGRLGWLTPTRAAVAPAIVPIPNAVAESVPPTVVDWGASQPWRPPATALELAKRVFLADGEIFVAATAFVVVGAATARGESRWNWFVIGALVLYGNVWGAANTTAAHGVVFWPLLAAIPGVVPAAIGYLAAEPSNRADRGDAETADPAVA